MFGIVFRHELFENTPWIHVHDRKLQKCHNRLFEFIAEKIPALKSRKIPFVMDREPALTRAVETYFPNMQVLHCWNHLKRDFKEELRKLGADQSEISIYLSDWKQMAQSESERDFDVAYQNLTPKWGEKAKDYFDRHMKKDLLKYSGRWIIEQFLSLYSEAPEPRASARDRTPVTPEPRASAGQSASDSLIDVDEGNKENEVLLKERDTSLRSLAKYVLDNKGVTPVPNTYIVKGHNEKKYCRYITS